MVGDLELKWAYAICATGELEARELCLQRQFIEFFLRVGCGVSASKFVLGNVGLSQKYDISVAKDVVGRELECVVGNLGGVLLTE